jgi:SAM-dependent methyltransferase
LTGSTGVKLIRNFDIDRIVRGYKSWFEIDVQHYFNGLESLPLYRCLETGYRFFHPPTLAAARNIYQVLSKEAWYYQTWKWEYEAAAQLLPYKSKFLDIGCGAGAFIAGMKERGIHGEGLETNSEALLGASQRGVQVIDESLESFCQREITYDAVCLFQVLEHVYHVRPFLEKCLGLLRPGGTLVIAVPNNNPYLHKYDDYEFLNLPPHHLGLWDEASLLQLGEILNLQVVALRTEPLLEKRHYFRVQVNHFTAAGGIPHAVRDRIAALLRVITTPIHSAIAGRNIFVAFRKL